MSANQDPDDNAYNDNVPDEILQEANNISLDLLPKKSRDNYDAAYEQFKKWKITKKSRSSSEAMLLVYFKELLDKYQYKPSTLWSRYSMLKCTLKTYENTDISKYLKLTAFLKKQNVGFHSKKSKVFTADEIQKFVNEAPDNEYLVVKVAGILGTTGGLRRQELTDLTVNDFVSLTSNQGERLLQIRIPDTKTHTPKSFVISDEFMNVVERYRALRPKNATSNRFFLKYQNGKCYQQNIGINKIGGMPKQVASYLKLPDAHLYTGHSWRRTSATLLADAGADIMTLKRHGGWKSDKVVEGYIEDSIHSKQKIHKQITESVKLIPFASKENFVETPPAKRAKRDEQVHCVPSTSTSREMNTVEEAENFQPQASASVESECGTNDKIIASSTSAKGVANVYHLHNCSNLTFINGQK